MKNKNRFVVHGRIINKKTQSGVFGLRAVLYDKDHLFDDLLGSTWTNEKGAFSIEYRAEDFRELFDQAPDLYVEVMDFRDATLYSTEDAVRWNAAHKTDLTIEVPPAKLAYHLDNFRPFQRLSGGLVAADKLKVINRAAKLLETRLSGGEVYFGYQEVPLPRAANFSAFNAAYCPAPNILDFTNLLDLASGVINHEAAAIPRFKDVINTVIYRKNVRKPEQVSAASERWTEQPSSDMKGFKAILESKRAGLPAAPTDTLIETNRIMTVIAAAVIVAGGDMAVENRYLSFLLGQVKGLGQMDAVFRAARNFLSTNPGDGFSDLLISVGGTCGPDDGPILFPPKPEEWKDLDEIWWLEMLQCSAEMTRAWRSGIGSGGTYHIGAVNWGGGCPGDPVVFTGENFMGIFPDRNCVNFTHRSGGTEMVKVYPATPLDWDSPEDWTDWTDTRIEVVLPPEAGPGPVNLSIVDGFATACGGSNEAARTGNSVHFTGGTAYIRNFFANGRRGPMRISADETVTLTWFVVPFYANVHLRVVVDGTAIEDSPGWPAEGSYTFTTPADHDSEITCTLTADAACPGQDTRIINILSGIDAELSVYGIEVTQAIQHYSASEHLTDVNDQGSDNSLQLVADKPAWVRVYMRSGVPTHYNSGQLRDINGSLLIERRVAGVWSSVILLGAINAPFIAEASFPGYPFERGNINTTLNFEIPRTIMSGLLRLTVNASSSHDFAGEPATDSVTVNVNLQQQLQVAALRIGYDGPNLAGTGNETHAAPPLNGAGANTVVAECELALTMFPVSSSINLRSIGVEDADTPLITTPAAGRCDPDWSPIVALVEDARINDGNQAGWIYYGFVTQNIPINHNPCCNTGCAIGIDAAGIIGNGNTFAHEAGHQVGMLHSPCGTVGTVNSRYPLYEPYDTGVTTVDPNGNTVWGDASIGEYGLDINNGDIFDPSTCEDYMSYCRPRWVSLYSHNHMLNNAALNPADLGSGFSAGGTEEAPGTGMGYFQTPDNNMPRPLITLRGYVDEAGNVTVRNVARMAIRQPPIDGRKTEYMAELIDEDGHTASSGFIYTSPQHWHSNTQNRGFKGGMQEQHEEVQLPFHFLALLEDVVEGKTIWIKKDNNILWQKDRPMQKPKLGNIVAQIDSDLRLKLSWDYYVPVDEQPTVWLRWSDDQGNSWNGLSVGIRKDFAELDINDLPAGKLIFQVISHDGFYTISKTSPSVTLPDRAPMISIIHPRAGSPVRANIPLRLLGAVTICSQNILKEEDFIWHIDGKEVGRGLDTWAQNPGKGKHKVGFEVKDPAGHSSVSTSIEVE